MIEYRFEGKEERQREKSSCLGAGRRRKLRIGGGKESGDAVRGDHQQKNGGPLKKEQKKWARGGR